jgi:hypothetical protein
MSKLEDSRSPDNIEVLRRVLDVASSEMFVALPGKVEKYDPVLQKADVKPLIQKPFVFEDGDEDLDELPVLTDVPVMFPRGGGYFLSLPIEPGDNVLLVFCDMSIDSFMVSTGGVDTNPVDLRTHDISDAVAIPGFYPFPKNIKDLIGSGAAFGKEQGVMMRATGSAMEVVTAGAPSASDFVAMSAKVDALWLAVTVFLATWVAPKTPDGGVALAAALNQAILNSPSYQATKSTNLKAD